VLFGLIECPVGTQFGLDLVVGGQRLAVASAELPGGLALGERKIVDAVLGHDARCRGGNPGTGAMLPRDLAAHKRLVWGRECASRPLE
jgi:hypothetical protein